MRINLLFITCAIGYMLTGPLGAILGGIFGLIILELITKKSSIWEMESSFIQYLEGSNDFYFWHNGVRTLIESKDDFVFEPVKKTKILSHFKRSFSIVFFKLFRPAIFFIGNIIRILFHFISSIFRLCWSVWRFTQMKTFTRNFIILFIHSRSEQTLQAV